MQIWLLGLLMTTMQDLDNLRWTNRVVVIFASGNESLLTEQDAILHAHAVGLTDRDIKLIHVTVDDPEQETLREKLGVSHQPFAFVLIGKDGSVKLRKYSIVTADELFQTIDAMPMRKQEMRRK